MLMRMLMLTTALVAVIPLSHAQAGGMGSFHMPSVRVPKVNCPPGGTISGHNWGGGGTTNITNNVNRSSNIFVNHSLNVYAPVNVTTNIDNSSNISANVNINNSKQINNSSVIDNSTNINVEKNISVRTTNIFNGMPGAGGSDHSQGGSWGSHSGGGGWGGGNMGGGGSNQNNNGNENNNSNSNTNGSNNNFSNNGANINAGAAIDSFFTGLRGLQN